MAANLNLRTGATYEITLQGAQRWVRAARIVSVLPGTLVLELDNGRQIAVPQASVISARPLTTVAPVPAGSAESFYAGNISEKGSDVSAARLLDLRTRLLKETGGIGVSGRLRNAIADALAAVARQLLENDFERHEAEYEQAGQNIADATAALDSAMSNGHRPPPYFTTLLHQLTYVTNTARQGHLHGARSFPDFVGFASRERFYVGDDQTFLLTASVGLPAGDAPVESVQLLLQPSPGLLAYGPAGFVQTLRPGETRELLQRLKVSDPVLLAAGEVSLSLSLRYRCASGHIEESAPRTMVAVLEPAGRFARVDNPYSRYSGGIPVEEGKMFFGRQELLERIHGEVTSGPLGQCFVLYGQKRSGKSSVLRQLAKRLRPPSLPIPVSLGTIDTGRAERSFVQVCVDSLYERLVHDYDITDVTDNYWPKEHQVDASPIESFRRSIRAATVLLEARKGWHEVRPIFLIDEFTYVYEYIQEGLLTPAFMRQWKSLLESRTFDAVLVGQDTMPRFKEAYPNEFGVTHDERISYLRSSEARALAEDPIKLAGESRYRGASLGRLLSLTAGSPFYLQIFCDRLVQHLNSERLMFVTESVIGHVLTELTTGSSPLTIDKFDPLITAAGESVAVAPKDQYLGLLTRVALNPLITAQDLADDDAPLVRDLLSREVLERDASGRLRIRVGLFAEWLTANNVGAAR